MFRPAYTIEPSFINTTSLMHRIPSLFSFISNSYGIITSKSLYISYYKSGFIGSGYKVMAILLHKYLYVLVKDYFITGRANLISCAAGLR